VFLEAELTKTPQFQVIYPVETELLDPKIVGGYNEFPPTLQEVGGKG
jgi:hypothetical protein